MMTGHQKGGIAANNHAIKPAIKPAI